MFSFFGRRQVLDSKLKNVLPFLIPPSTPPGPLCYLGRIPKLFCQALTPGLRILLDMASAPCSREV